MSEPLPLTVKVPPLKVALPAIPTAPMSAWDQPAGNVLVTAPFTTNLTVVECDRLPFVPVTVNVLVPAGVEPVVLTVRVDEPEPVTEAGLKPPVAPVGRP